MDVQEVTIITEENGKFDCTVEVLGGPGIKQITISGSGVNPDGDYAAAVAVNPPEEAEEDDEVIDEGNPTGYKSITVDINESKGEGHYLKLKYNKADGSEGCIKDPSTGEIPLKVDVESNLTIINAGSGTVYYSKSGHKDNNTSHIAYDGDDIHLNIDDGDTNLYRLLNINKQEGNESKEQDSSMLLITRPGPGLESVKVDGEALMSAER